MTGPLVGVTVLQPASGTVARPVHDLFGAGDRSRWPADNTGRQGAPQPRPRERHRGRPEGQPYPVFGRLDIRWHRPDVVQDGP